MMKWENCLIAATLGAEIIERHITTDKSSFGLDHTTSSNPSEFALLGKYLKSFPMILKGTVLEFSIKVNYLINKI